MSMCRDSKLTTDSKAQNNIIPLRVKEKVGCKCVRCAYPTSAESFSLCESCLTVQAMLDRYSKTQSDLECSELVEAIWNLQCAKMQIKNAFLMFPLQPPDDVVLTMGQLQRRLKTLISSLERIKQENQLYLLLAVIARETDLILKTKKAQWWMS